MSDQYRNNRDDDLAYGEDYDRNRGYGDQSGGDRSLIGDTFNKLRTKYDKYNRPQGSDPYGYASGSGSQQQQSYNQSGYGGGYQQPSQTSYQGQPQGQYQGQYQSQSQNQPPYVGGPPPQPARPQQKPDFADKIFSGIHGAVHSIGSDVAGILGTRYDAHRPPQSGQTSSGAQTAQGTVHNRFDSFAAPKSGNEVKWYVDGCAYMWAVSEALERARESIWILDWWLSPELYLRRPPAANEEWRIDKVLLRAANRGVKINVIVYKEVTQALTLSSSHTKHALEALSPNIGVFRHPDHLPDAQTTHSSILSSLQGLKLDAAGASKLGADALKGIYGLSDGVILYWAHHEKLCLIDQNIAFMGGLDLCYGRWDTNQHSISDAHPSDLNKIVFPGQDFNNARVMDFNDVANPFQNKLDRTKSSRMGWSDISICLRGPCVDDLRHHFTDRWNFIYDEKYNVRSDIRYARLPLVAGHRPGEAQQVQTGPGSQQSLQPGQYPPPPGSQTYTQPPWKSTSRPHTPNTAQQQSTQSYSPQTSTGQYNASQQGVSYPPPPPGPPPQSYGPPSPGNRPSSSQGPQQGYTAQQPYQGYQQQPPQSQSHPQYSEHQQQSNPSQYQGYGQQHSPLAQQSQQSQQPQSQYQGFGQEQPQQQTQSQYSQYSQPQSQEYGQPQQQQLPQQSQSQYQGYGQQQQSQQPQHQYQGYEQPSQPQYQGHQQQQQQPQSQYNTGYSTNTPELPTGQSQYEQHMPSGTSRGLDDEPDYYESEHGGERGYGRGSGGNSGRIGKYKDEGRRLGNELGAIGNMIGQRVESKVSRGPHSRPQSRAGGAMHCQLIRSCTKWSNGTPTEHSIQNAYIDVILNSQHFIYIENQFFITATGDKQRPVKNQIGKALVDRILRAARNNERYFVIVLIPAIPAFAGDFIDESSLGTRAICEFQYFSICRGGNSIMEKIAEAGYNPMDYIRFYNLRNYDRINFSATMTQVQNQSGVAYEDARKQQENVLGAGYGGQGYGQGYNQGYNPAQQGTYGTNPAQQYQSAAQSMPASAVDRWDSVASCYMLGGEDIRKVPWSGPPEAELDAFVSEELYIHSKVMIADDRIVICGSANLNDRSMLGYHDSEIALLINDPTLVESTMAGRPWQASRFAASLRRQLLRKHLGLIPPQDFRRPDVNFQPLGPLNEYDWGSPEDRVVADPLSETFMSLWNTRARTNTEVYRKAFRAVPDDYVRTWSEYKEFFEYYFHKADEEAVGKDKHEKKPSRVEYGHVVRQDFPGGVRELKELLSKIKGTLVEMPLCFLQNEDIAKEGLSLNALTEEIYT